MAHKPQKLKGFRDYLPGQAQKRRDIMNHVLDLAEDCGFCPIDTPVLEYAKTLLGSGGGDTDKEVYLFKDHGDRDIGLRFDLTVPFARYVAENYSQLVMPFKKVQVGLAWRGEKPQKGRYREFCQGDLDIVGADSMAADAEILLALRRILANFLPGGFTQLVGQRQVLSGLLQHFLGDLNPESEAKALIILDKLAKIGEAKVVGLLAESWDQGGATDLVALLAQRDQVDWSVITNLFKGRGEMEAHLSRFQDTIALVNESAPAESGKTMMDLSIARGLNYYTGIVFETFVEGLPKFGSVSSGGRYNGLVSEFINMELPGVGGSIGVDRLLAAIEELGIEGEEPRRGVYIAVAGEEAFPYGFKLCQTLRQAGLMCDINVKPGKLGNQFKFADRRHYRFVVTLGSQEVENQTISLKDLGTGVDQKDVSAQGLADILISKQNDSAYG